VLHGGFPELPYNMIADRQIKGVFNTDRDFHIQIFNEYRDEKRLSSDDRQFMQFLEQKYQGQKFDLIFAVSPIALRLLLKERGRWWPDVPVVFSTIERRMVPENLPPNFFGVASTFDFAGTLDLALRLQPDVDRVFYIVGASEWEQFARRSASDELRRFEGRVTIEYLDNLAFPDLLMRVSQLPPRSIVLYQEFNKDVSGRVYIPAQVCIELSVSSSVPVYGPVHLMLGHGIVGGSLADFEGADRQAALEAMRILQGQRPPVQVEAGPPSKVSVDWRQLRRWQISESRLPVGAMVEFREPGLWQRYKWYMLMALLAFAFQSILIVRLKLEAIRRQKSESELERLSGHLINAQEEERRRIARELHDDIAQRITLVCVSLQELAEARPAANEQKNGISDVASETESIARDISRMSHGLHSSALESLGLVGAIRNLTRQISGSNGPVVEFSAEDGFEGLSPVVTLSLFRITQEALRNVAKHSGAKRSDVRLCRVDHGRILQLMVSDTGRGFSNSSAKGEGLGLISMRERARLAGGELIVRSSPMRGTEIEVRVPIAKTKDTGESLPRPAA